MSAGSHGQEGGEPTRPVLRIVRGDATPEQVAALVGVFAAMGSAPELPPRVASPWMARTRLGSPAPSPGPAAWRLSMRPQ